MTKVRKMLLAVGGEPRSVTGLVPERAHEDSAQDIAQDNQYWDSPSHATLKGTSDRSRLVIL